MEFLKSQMYSDSAQSIEQQADFWEFTHRRAGYLVEILKNQLTTKMTICNDCGVTFKDFEFVKASNMQIEGQDIFKKFSKVSSLPKQLYEITYRLTFENF